MYTHFKFGYNRSAITDASHENIHMLIAHLQLNLLILIEVKNISKNERIFFLFGTFFSLSVVVSETPKPKSAKAPELLQYANLS
jgi:hypothetical protein